MSVTTEVGLVDQAAKHCEKKNLITSVGIPPDWRSQLTTYDATMLLVYSESLADISEWVLSDLLCWVEERLVDKLGGISSGRAFWDERDKRWKELVRTSKRSLAHGTLYNMKATAKAFPWLRRRHSDTIGYEHHRLVSAMPDNQQDHWLDEAQANGWSSYDLRLRLYPNNSGAQQEDTQALEDIVASHLERYGMRYHRQAMNRLALHVGNAQLTIHAVSKAGKPCIQLNWEEV